MIKLIGKIKKMNNVTILNLYSKNLGNEISKINNKILVKNYKDGLKIEPNGNHHATIARNRRIQISITNLIKKGIVDYKKIEKKEIPVYINLSEWNLKEISKNGIGLPISKDIPENLISKRAAIRNNKNKYLIDISSKKLHDLCVKNRIRCLFNRLNKEIILIRSNLIESRRICPHSKKRVQICIPKEILNKDEIENLSNLRWLPINIRLNLESFGLKIIDFYSVSEERELVRYLIERKLKIEVKDYRDPYDIFLPEYNSGIEIHNSMPYSVDLSTRHKVKPGQVRLRILEADNLIRNKKVNNFFVILNNGWENGRFIKELTDNLSKGVYVFFTDFKRDWYKNIGEKIVEHSRIN